MQDSILNSIKKLLGIDSSYIHFDMDVMTHINTAFMVLHQLGAGPIFSIHDASTQWNAYSSDMEKLELIKTYIYLKVKLVFDPPQSSAVIEAIKTSISELEWRINVQVDPGEQE